jgi:hypothetical protein
MQRSTFQRPPYSFMVDRLPVNGEAKMNQVETGTDQSEESASAELPAVVHSPPSPYLDPRIPPPRSPGANQFSSEVISMWPIKEAIRGLSPDPPLRIVLMGEPDEMPRTEYGTKLMGWLRLLHAEKW